MFEGCGGIEDPPQKSIKRVSRSSANINLPTVSGKRRHRATTAQQDNTIIFIDDDDDDEVVEFVPKKQRVGNYGSTRTEDIQNHVAYPTPSISKAHVLLYTSRMLQC